MSDYGIPYMGSKAKIARSICMKLPKADHFYDLFGGGFSITHCMIKDFQHKYRTFNYNEIKSDVVQLVRDAIAGKYNYDVYKPEWISKEDFERRKTSDAFVRCIWSFGNNQKSYLFGDVENYKRSLHMAIVFDDFDDISLNLLGFKTWPAYAKTIKQRRLFFRQQIAFNGKNTGIKRGDLEKLQHLQQLERLERLQRLQRLQQLQQLEMTSGSYDQVEILPNSVVYCDIPYEGTADYGGGFNRKKFLDWASSAIFPVYISEYNVSDPRFQLVYEIDKRSMLSSKKHLKVMSEKLYWNGK